MVSDYNEEKPLGMPQQFFGKRGLHNNKS